jgi:hypothetical protein
MPNLYGIFPPNCPEIESALCHSLVHGALTLGDSHVMLDHDLF